MMRCFFLWLDGQRVGTEAKGQVVVIIDGALNRRGEIALSLGCLILLDRDVKTESLPSCQGLLSLVFRKLVYRQTVMTGGRGMSMRAIHIHIF